MAKKTEARTTMKRVCAWCNGVIQDGTEPATHGICRPCGEKVMDSYGRSRSSSVSRTPKNPHGVPSMI